MPGTDHGGRYHPEDRWHTKPGTRTSLMDSRQPIFAAGLPYPFEGTFVAVVDVNRDGKPDLVVAADNFPTSLVAVLLGNGDGTFQPPVIYDSGGLSIFAMAVADLNHDGQPDLVLVNSGAFSVLMGNSDGTFQPAVVYNTFGGNSIALTDINGDGRVDLVIANQQYPSEGYVGVALGNGDGTFRLPVFYDPGGTFTDGVAIADLNHDGKPDLVITNGDAGGKVCVLLGKGDGSFQAATCYAQGGLYFPETSSPVVADVNGDGRPDLVVANQASKTVGVLLGNGDGTFQPVATYLLNEGEPSSVGVADVDGDGKPDLIIATSNLPTVHVLLGNGDGSFQGDVEYYSGGGPLAGSASLAVADLNGDGKPDLAVTTGVLLNNRGAPPTTTTLVSNPNPALYQHPVTYTATVSAQSGGTVTGSVKFDIDTYPFFKVAPLTNNQATVTAQYLQRGSYPITANYSGDLHNARSASATLVEYISSIASKTVVTSSKSPSILGQSVTFTARVTSATAPIPDGEPVTFYNGSTAIGRGTTTAGVATFSTSSLTLGWRLIEAAYSGDRTFGPSSNKIWQVVNGYPTTTTFTSSQNPSIYGQLVTFTAKVTTSGPSALTGKVNFTWGKSIGWASVDTSGVATLRRTDISAGSYPLTAVYWGDTNNAQSTSAVVNQVIHATTSAATLVASPNPSTLGQAVTFTAKITSPTFTPTGSVTFTAGTTILGTAKLSSGKGIFTTTSLPVGSTAVTVTYPGNASVAKSSASVTDVVNP